MCGISVIISCEGKPIPKSFVQAMNGKIAHRGPNDGGVFIEDNIGMGHRRLSILDLSVAGRQPMEYKSLVIVFNGEIYNFIELRKELIEKGGYAFQTSTDTEVILAAYHYWGKECIERFNGMWSFVIYDKSQKKLFCSRDRFGIKPFCYGKVGGNFVIASEPKQFFALEGFSPIMDMKTAYAFLKHGILNTDEHTFFEGIMELRGGYNMVYDLDTNQKSIYQWYNVEERTREKLKNLTFEQAAKQFNELFQRSVELRLRSDVKLGACLSGGMDSSSIVSVAQQFTHPIHTVSSCYENKRYDEQQYIDVVNSRFNLVSHKVFPDMRDLFRKGILKKIVYHQDQPIPTGSHFSEYKVFETAGEDGLIVMLDGQGADEYLAGYNEFFSFYWKKLLLDGNLGQLKREISFKANNRNSSFSKELKSFANFLFLNSVKKSLKAILGIKKDSFLTDDFEKKNKENRNYSLKAMSSINSIYDVALHELVHISIPYQLHSEDRNSMMHSVESRLPFLDVNLVEFCLRLPDRFKIKDGKTKAVLREGMQAILPDEIVNRHDKMGFVAPDEIWIKENSDEFRQELENAVLNLEGIVSKKILHQFDEMILGKRAFNNTYFRVVSLNCWCEEFGVKIL